MSEPKTLLSLPPELRTIIYEYVALSHASRQIRVDGRAIKTTTSALVGTCRLINFEYPDAAGSAVTELRFTVNNLKFAHVIRFMRKLGKRTLTIPKRSKANLVIDLAFPHEVEIDLDKVGRWLGLCAQLKMRVIYNCEGERDDFCLESAIRFLSQVLIRDNNHEHIAAIFERVRSARAVHEGY